MTKQYGIIIIGVGPGGLTAALHTARANLSVLILDYGVYGGQMNNTGTIDSYPDFLEIQGPELSEKIYQSVMEFGPEFKYGDVTGVGFSKKIKLVKTSDAEYEVKAVITATGAEHKHLGVPGEEEYSGRGVSYCAVCDAVFLKDEDVVVVGGGGSAIEEGLYLANIAKSVTVIHRHDSLRAQPVLQKRAFANSKMNFIWDAQTEEIIGNDQKVTAIKYLDKETGEHKEINASGIFIYVGVESQTSLFKELGIIDKQGWVITNEKMQTSLDRIFALGDVRAKDLRQITNAVGDGSIARQEAYNYLQSLND